ncbi:anaphase-promoting complex subunit 1 [Anopheles aquasalis]|uniref:anaphase-promoting complex subunit 1 n=1 Tax=Anopheles aquasalis TaxID=42839 RepID=UPI00215B4A92|nr:anaphase-promoting complex subunit 1 [Anopheles aquasalis]
MITASEPLEYIPRGRQAANLHPGQFWKVQHEPEEHELTERLQAVSISADDKAQEEEKEFYSLRGPRSNAVGPEGWMQSETIYNHTEEELYVRGNLAIWTRALGKGETTVKGGKSLPRVVHYCETVIQHAFFAPNQFLVNQTVQAGKENAAKSGPTGFCVIDQQLLNVYCDTGEMYSARAEGPISAIWPVPCGILIEKEPSTTTLDDHDRAIPMPRLFTLTFPTDDMHPVMLTYLTQGILTEPYRVVFSSERLDVVIMYDEHKQLHFICRLQPIPAERSDAMLVDESVAKEARQFPFEAVQAGVRGNTLVLGNKHKANKQRQVGGISDRLGGNDVPELDVSKQRETLGTTAADTYTSLHLTAHGGQQGHGRTTSPLSFMGEETHMPLYEPFGYRNVTAAKPILPEYELVRIWTEETEPSTRGSPICLQTEPATMGFLHTDLAGCQYLCYLCPSIGRLTMLPYEPDSKSIKQNQQEQSRIISAWAAIEVERLNVFAVITPWTGQLLLYSGPLRIGKVHLTGLLYANFLSASRPSNNSSSSAMNGGLMAPPPTGVSSSSFGSLPRRSSLLPNALPAQADRKFEEDLHGLSPVRPSVGIGHCFSSGSTIDSVLPNAIESTVTLRDPIENRFTIAYGDRHFRLALPAVAESPLVRRVLNAIRTTLPACLALEFLVRWYAIRNVPGSQEDMGMHQEWQQLRSLLYNALGRPLVPSATAANNRSPGEEPKKRRKDERRTQGTCSDWEFLLCHALAVNDEVGAGPNAGSGRPYEQHDQRILYPHLPRLWQCLHLLYEDLRLDAGMLEGQRLLGEFLFCLAVDAGLERFQLHYLTDFPVFTTDQQQNRCRIDEPALLEQLCHGFASPAGDPPHLYRYLEQLVLRGNDPKYLELSPFRVQPHVNELTRDVVFLFAVLYRVHSLRGWVEACLEELQLPALDGQITWDDTSPQSQIIVRFLVARGYSRARLNNLPFAIRFVVLQCLETYRGNVRHKLPRNVYEELLLRPDLSEQTYHASLRGVPDDHKTYLDSKLMKWVVDLCEPETNTSVFDEGIVRQQQQQQQQLPQSQQQQQVQQQQQQHQQLQHQPSGPCDGMEQLDLELLALRFPGDRRIDCVRAFLDSTQQVTIDIVQARSVSDHDFTEEQEKRLYALCLRTMSQPIGRGMFTFATYLPQEAEVLAAPKLCLTGRDPERGATVEIHQIEVPTNMELWPTFHNGVASGLRLSPESPGITAAWIMNNSSRLSATNRKSTAEERIEHGGFLLALGLTGHLHKLELYPIYEYMVQGEDIVRVALLIGLSASRRGSMDETLTRMLSVHLEALLPPTSVDLDIAQNVRVAALMGLGLLYHGSCHSRTAEVLLQEIGRPPGPEMENYLERESYALTAGLALGLVTLGQGTRSKMLDERRIPEMLYNYMNGGTRMPAVGPQKEKYKLSSFQIREGGAVNVDVTAPGAILALGLMYHRTGDTTIAGWLHAGPTNQEGQLKHMRPDMLLLRGLARHLILWDKIEPTTAWVHGQMPPTLKDTVASIKSFYRAQKTQPTLRWDSPHRCWDSAVPQCDWPNLPATQSEAEFVCQAHCNSLCAGLVAIGLRYAGTADQQATDTVYDAIRYLLALRPNRPIGNLAGSQTVENCTMMALLALALVQAGNGSMRVLRLIRMLRSRVARPHVTYGSFMAIHMALGLLFLGGGRYSISRSPIAIAALVIALFPKLPTYSNDNRYHLQALRHLYVLALEPRLLVLRNMKDWTVCQCEIEYVMKDRPNEVIRARAPFMLPELDTMLEMCIVDPSFWPVRFNTDSWSLLADILRCCGYVKVLQRVGQFSYDEDPSRHLAYRRVSSSLLSHHCVHGRWKKVPALLHQFDDLPEVSGLLRTYLPSNLQFNAQNELLNEPDRQAGPGYGGVRMESLLLVLVLPQVYECIMQDRLHALPIFLDLTKILLDLDRKVETDDAWQLRLFTAIQHNRIQSAQDSIAGERCLLLDNDVLSSTLIQIESSCERLCTQFATEMRCYLGMRGYRERLGDDASTIAVADRLSRLVVGESTSCPVAIEQRNIRLGTLMRLIVLYDLPYDLLHHCSPDLHGSAVSILQLMLVLRQRRPDLDVRTLDLIANLLHGDNEPEMD